MRKDIFSALWAALWVIVFFLAMGSMLMATNSTQLDAQYKEWLDVVCYIITPTEKEVFTQLTNNRQRDNFITMFWNLRDPSKGTLENEFKEAHLKRFQYAAHYFKFGSPLPGWKTDRGHIWIILGPPANRNMVDNNNGLYPVDIWEYFGGTEKGLPTVFRVVFYKPSGAGDYKLYMPTDDGPAALLRSSIAEVDNHDYRTIYEKINALEPAVADISLSLIPGESVLHFTPSLQAPLLISDIYELPKKQINATYARHFLNYQGLVETNVVTNYINLKTEAYLFYDALLKLNFVHFALLPEKISVDYLPDKDIYYFNYDLLVLLKKGEQTVWQYTKKYPFYYSKEELETKLANGIIITDYFPVIPGAFKLIVLLQNSLNKELSYDEKQIKTDENPGTTAHLYGPVTTYQFNQEYQPVYGAFNLMDTNIKIDPQKIFGQKDTVYSFFSVARGEYTKELAIHLEVISVDETRPFQKMYAFALPATDPFKNVVQPLENLKYGHYEVKASVLEKTGEIIAMQTNDFQVSPEGYVPHPPLVSKTLKREHAFMFDMMVAQQYYNLNLWAEAEKYFEKALNLNPHFPELIKSYTTLLFKVKKYTRILEVIQNMEPMEKEAFDYYALKGRALYYLGNYKAALDSLLKANKIYDSDMVVLNTLGLSFLRLGNKEEAIRVLAASLKINDGQRDIHTLLNQLVAEKK